MRSKSLNPRSIFLWEVEFHVASYSKKNQTMWLLLEFVEEFLGGSAEYIMNFVDLVEFVVAGEQREKTEHLEEHAANAPVVHPVVVVPVRQQALRRPVPTRGDVLREWLLRVDSSARTEIC